MDTLYFAQLYRGSSTVVYMKGTVVNESEKALKFKLMQCEVKNPNVGDEMWIPRSALTETKQGSGAWDIARWFMFEDGSYASKVYENSVMCIK